MRFATSTADQRLSPDAVLAVTVGHDPRTLSAFEAAVVAALDGVRDNAAVAAAVGVAYDDLATGLAVLIARGWLHEATVRPALRLAPAALLKLARTTTPAPAPLASGHDDRNGAASLQARCLRALRKGDGDDARALAEQAASLAPGVDSHRAVVAGWDDHVGRHLGAELHGAARVAVVRAHLEKHPKSPAVWSLLGVLLANDDVADLVGAADAAARAEALAPTPERKQQARALASLAGREARRDKVRSWFGGAAPKKPARGR